VDSVAPDYADEVTFLAIAWKSSFDRAQAVADELLTSGTFRWGIDETELIFASYLLSSQPWTVLISADGVEVERWPGGRPAGEIRASIERLLES
jgi:hypothetical protein